MDLRPFKIETHESIIAVPTPDFTGAFCAFGPLSEMTSSMNSFD
jgi:hypothetical protein